MITLIALACTDEPDFGAGGQPSSSSDDSGQTTEDEAAYLDFDISDVEYSSSLDVLVALDAANRRVVLLDSEVAETSIDLPADPIVVSISPDGLEAVVGMDGTVAVVDVESAEITALYDLSVVPHDIVHGGNGWAYVFPNASGWTELHCVDLDDGEDHVPEEYMSVNERMIARLHPRGDAIYAADNGISPSDAERYDISDGIAGYDWDSPYHGDYSFGGDLWLSDDGSFLVTRSGNAFATSPDEDLDLVYEGSVEGPVGWSAINAHLGRVVVIDDDGALSSYDSTYLASQGAIGAPVLGRYAFFTEDASALRVVGQSSNGQWALATVDAPGIP